VSAEADEAFYRAAMARIYRLLVVVSIAGTVFAFAWKGWPAGGGFALGAAASTLSFRWLHRLVNALGARGQQSGKGRLAWLFGFRYLIFGLSAYVIVKYFGINPVAVVLGLFAAAAAVLIEILFELIYART
jgi:hypothetical protein